MKIEVLIMERKWSKPRENQGYSENMSDYGNGEQKAAS